MQLAVSTLISIDVLINPLMTDAVISMLLHSEQDLFRAPVLSDLFLNPGPGLGMNSLLVSLVSARRFTMCSLGSIATLSIVSFQLSIDGRSVYTNYVRNFCLGFATCPVK